MTKNPETSEIIILSDWQIITDIQTRGDPLRLYGRVFNHPSISDGEYGCPSTFVSFDPINKIGIGLSGKIYQLENFIPNGNAKTEDDGIEFLMKTAQTAQAIRNT